LSKNFLLLAFVSTIFVGCGAADMNETQAQSLKRSHSGVEHENSQLAEKSSRVNTVPLKLPNQSAKPGGNTPNGKTDLSAVPRLIMAGNLEAAKAPESVPVAVNSSRAVPEKAEAGESPQAALDRQVAEFRERITFVDLTYKICLGREPDSPGLLSWSNLIATKKATFEQVQTGICSSAEGQIARAYKELLGRSPDPDGRDAWLAELNGGRLSIEQIRQLIENSDERKAINLLQKINNLRAQIATLEKERSVVVARLAGL
jgi:hypothetical protein